MVDFERYFMVTVSEDEMEARVIFSTPRPGEDLPAMDHAALGGFLRSRGLSRLIGEALDEVVTRWQRREAPDEPIVIARGLEARSGRDGEVEWLGEFFAMRHRVDESGNSNFYERATPTSVASAMEIAVLHEPEPGQSGETVKGKSLSAQAGKGVALRGGEGIESHDQGRRFRATRTGRVTLVGDTVSIPELYEIPGDVDVSTGNVTFKGVIHVHGNVLDLFSLKSMSQIIVDGFVEGAFLTCDGDISIQSGITGRGKGQVSAGGTVFAKYATSANIRAGNTVAVENNISASDVRSAGVVEIPQGAILGGQIWARDHILARIAGTASGTRTELVVGRDWRLEQEAEALARECDGLEQRLQSLNEQVALIKPRLARLGDAERDAFKQQLLELKTLGQALQRCSEERARLKDQASALAVEGEVIITERVFPGVVVHMGTMHHTSLTTAIQGPVKFRYNRALQKITIQGLEG